MNKSALFLATVSIALLSGCASIINEPSQPVKVTSSTGAPISGSINGTKFQSPAVVNVIRSGNDQVVVTETAGCDKETPLKKSVSPIFFGNIIIGGVLGSTTDYSTEKMWAYDEAVVISCKK
jgi:hypothetical protein